MLFTIPLAFGNCSAVLFLLLVACSLRLVASLKSSWTLDLRAALARTAMLVAAMVAMLARLVALEGLRTLEGRLSSLW